MTTNFDTRIGFDMETTGTDIARDRPVQVSLILSVKGEPKRILLNSLCNPLMPIPDEAANVHGVTDEAVQSAPDYLTVLWHVAMIVERMHPFTLVSMNGKSFDVPMAEMCFGTPIFSHVPHFDILQMAFRFFPELTNRKLGNLYLHFLKKELVGAHDATTDVFGTLDVFDAMRAKIGMRSNDLLDELNTPKPYSIIPFGKHMGKAIDEVPVGWAQFMDRTYGSSLNPDLRATVNYILGKR
jgi:DNA polymerase-3 subunit epsilon